MAKKSATIARSAKTGKFTVGRVASTKISKVEGLVLSRDMKETFRSFDERNTSNDDRRAALINKYGKKGR